jgi:hypothetical protein
MSFGFSVSDFVLLVQLAHKSFRNCKNAGPEYREISREIRSLHSVLRNLRDKAQKQDSNVFEQDSALNGELLQTANGCKDILDTLDGVLGKYNGLQSGGEAGIGPKTWQRLRFGSKIEELDSIRNKIITYTSTISVLLDTMQLKASDRIETKLKDGFTEMTGQFEKMRREIYRMAAHARTSDQNSSTLSLFSLSTYTDDGKEVWQEFRRELIKKGFKSGSLDRHKHVLQAYMLKLDQSGILDQGHDHSWSPDTPWWARSTYTNTVHSWERMDFPASPNPEEITVDENSIDMDLGKEGVKNAKSANITNSPPLEPKSLGDRPRGDLAQAWMFGSRIALSEQGRVSEDQRSEATLEGGLNTETEKYMEPFSPAHAVKAVAQYNSEEKVPLPALSPQAGSNRAAELEKPSNAIGGPLEVLYDANSDCPPSRSFPVRDDWSSTFTRMAEKTTPRLKSTKIDANFAVRDTFSLPPLRAVFVSSQVVEAPMPAGSTISDWSLAHREQSEILSKPQKQAKRGTGAFKRVKITEEEPRVDAKLPPGKQGQSILKQPRESFPIKPLFPREGVAPKYIRHGIPHNARWTKISRHLVCPEALESGKERFETRDDCLIILRVLTREDIEQYRNLTRWMKCT